MVRQSQPTGIYSMESSALMQSPFGAIRVDRSRYLESIMAFNHRKRERTTTICRAGYMRPLLTIIREDTTEMLPKRIFSRRLTKQQGKIQKGQKCLLII